MKRTISLNGHWDFVADLDPKYHALYGGFHLPEADRRHWRPVPVPGVWQKYGERYDIFEGVCWFARHFDVPPAAVPGGAAAATTSAPPAPRATLHFGAINYLANVYLNGQHVGRHEGGYTAFAIDVTGKLKPGANHLAVQVDNRSTITKWPPVLGYFNYGGIHRGVCLEIAQGPTLDDVSLRASQAAGGWDLQVDGSVGQAVGQATALTVRVSMGPQRAWTAKTGADGRWSLRAAVGDVPAWSPQRPHLEAISIELLDAAGGVADRQDLAFGFRTLSVREGKVHLNGRPYPLQGVCYVYDSPVSGLVMTPEQIEADLRLMKDAGCNAVRCHYPMDGAFYAACDRAGLLVWIEPPVYCYHPDANETGTRFADAEWSGLAQRMALEMIAVARNHASVAIYSIGNECNTSHPEAEAFFRDLAGTIRKADPTRLLSYAALYGNVGPLAGMVDVLGVNSYYGWYDQIRQDGSDKRASAAGAGDDAVAAKRAIDLAPMRAMLDKVLAGRPGLALFLTEFGADADPGYRSACRELWSEDYQADLLRAILALAREYPQIVGTFPFCFSDYRDPSKIVNGYWNELNLKGVVNYHRRPKRGYAAIAQAYAGPTGA